MAESPETVVEEDEVGSGPDTDRRADYNIWIAAVLDPDAGEFPSEVAFEGISAETATFVRPGDLVLIGPGFRHLADSKDWRLDTWATVSEVRQNRLAVSYPGITVPVPAESIRAAAPELEIFDREAALSLVEPEQWARLFTILTRNGWIGLDQYQPTAEPERWFQIDAVSHDESIRFEADSLASLSVEFRYDGNQLFEQPRIRLEGEARVVGFPKGAGEGSTGIELGDVLEVKTVFAPIDAVLAAGDRETMTYLLPNVLPSARYDIEWYLYNDTHGAVSDPFSTQLEVEPSSTDMVPESKVIMPRTALGGLVRALQDKTLDPAQDQPTTKMVDRLAVESDPATKQTAVLPIPDQAPSTKQTPSTEQALTVDQPLEPATAEAEQPEQASAQPLAPQSPSAPSPVPATPPTVQDTRVEQRIVLIQQELAAPPAAATLRVRIDDVVTVTFAGQTYTSPLELDESALPNPEQSPQAYGEALFAALFNDTQKDAAAWPPTGDGYRAARNSAHDELSVELIIDDPSLRRMQWEYLRDPRAGELALRNRSPLVRRVGDPKPKPTAKPLNVLTAICSPASMPAQMAQLDIPAWSATVAAAFAPLQAAGLATNRLATSHDLDGDGNLLGLTHQRLNELLNDDVDVLHLVCHAGSAPGADGKPTYQLAIDNADDGTYAVPAEQLQFPDSLQLVVLAACDGFDPRQSGPTAALGNRLIERGVPAVISMQRRLHSTTAMLFTERFYHDLARSGRVDMALARTRRYLQNNRHNEKTDWGVPVLHLGRSDGRIMDLDDDAGARLGDFVPTATPTVGTSPDTLRLLAAQAAAVDSGDATAVAALGREMASAVAESQAIAQGQDVAAIDATITDTVRLDPTELGEFIDYTTGIRLPERFCLQVTSALNIGKHIVLIGVPGTGKTTISQAICRYAHEKLMSGPPVFATASADWTTFDTVGGYVPTANHTLAFRQGIFLNAIGAAGWLALDEVNRADIDKAIGELFTVMAGQSVDLPFTVGADNVRIVAPATDGLAGWRPDHAASPFHYVVHPNWRIVATMNVFDKASLFSMSNAFMRRLAFIDAGIPPKDMYSELLAKWNAAEAGKTGAAEAAAQQMGVLLSALLDEDESWIMQHRQIGPAIAKDLLEFAYQQHQHGIGVGEAFAEALLLFVLPQFDGLSRGDALDVCVGFEAFFESDQAAIDLVQERICDLYPSVADALDERAAAVDG